MNTTWYWPTTSRRERMSTLAWLRHIWRKAQQRRRLGLMPASTSSSTSTRTYRYTDD